MTLALALALPALWAAAPLGAVAEGERAPVVARLGDQEIRLDEVEARVALELFKLRLEVHALLERAAGYELLLEPPVATPVELEARGLLAPRAAHDGEPDLAPTLAALELRHLPRLRASLGRLRDLGVRSAPVLFVNGRYFSPSFSYERLEALVRAPLRQPLGELDQRLPELLDLAVRALGRQQPLPAHSRPPTRTTSTSTPTWSSPPTSAPTTSRRSTASIPAPAPSGVSPRPPGWPVPFSAFVP